MAVREKTWMMALGAAALVAGSYAASAQTTTLRAASCFPVGHSLSVAFEAYVNEVNATAKGWSIRYVGGAPAIGSPFTMVQNMSKGVYDMTFCPNSYYQNVLPEADALKLSEKSAEEIRKNGGFEYIDKLHQEKGAKLLARLNNGLRMHLYLRDNLEKADLKGLQIRAAPIYAPFFQALGATTTQTDLTQVFTYMENKTVDGYGWPAIGLLPDWYRVTGFRVDPGFYDAGIELLMNLDSWRALSDEQRKVITDLALKHELSTQEETRKATEAARAQQTEKGIKPATLTGPELAKWQNTARDAGWETVLKVSPKHGAELKKFFSAN